MGDIPVDFQLVSEPFSFDTEGLSKGFGAGTRVFLEKGDGIAVGMDHALCPLDHKRWEPLDSLSKLGDASDAVFEFD